MSNTMREILFRGKRVDNGEWVKGFLSKSRNIEEKPALLKPCIDYEKKGVMMSSIVDPETVGQFTGLTDKNGNKIFEGDIVKHYNHKNNRTSFDIGLVFWDVNKCRFVRTSKDDDRIYEIRLNCMNNYEIICNIHDNLELLEKSNV